MNACSKSVRFVAGALGVVTGLACGTDRGPRMRSVERDSAGVRISESAPPFEEWSLRPVAEVRIGVIEGDAVLQLHNVRYAARLRDGRVVLIDRGSLDVRLALLSDGHVVPHFDRALVDGEDRIWIRDDRA
ncbi:MAG: hypothetical protein L0271_12970 [Gemmatimonadetes bacterium]|nr:hypothetical protein [Gemmatimonadota bacterium]